MRPLRDIPKARQKSGNTPGAELIWSGRALQMPIGPSEKTWDLVALVRYPSAKAYIEMIATKAYAAARAHRRAALYDSRLIMTVENA
jgi:uncharacterized protein (DUF1330 family)